MDPYPYKDKLPSFFRRRALVAPIIAYERNDKVETASYLRSLNSVNTELSKIHRSMPSEELNLDELSAQIGGIIFTVKSICDRAELALPSLDYENEALRMSLEDFRSAFAPFLQEKLYQEVKDVEQDLRLWKHYSFRSPTSLIQFIFSALRSYAQISKEHFPTEKFTEFLVRTKQRWKDMFEVEQEYSSDEEGQLSNSADCRNCVSLHAQLDLMEMKYIAECEAYQSTVNELKETVDYLQHKTPRNDSSVGKAYEEYLSCIIKDIENLLDCEISPYNSDPINLLPKVWMQVRGVIANAGRLARSKKNNACNGHVYNATNHDLKNILFELKSVLDSLVDGRVFKLNIGNDTVTIKVSADDIEIVPKKINTDGRSEFDSMLSDIKKNLEDVQTDEFRDLEARLESQQISNDMFPLLNSLFPKGFSKQPFPESPLSTVQSDSKSNDSGQMVQFYVEQVRNLRLEVSDLRQQLDYKETELRVKLYNSQQRPFDAKSAQKELKALRKSLKEIDSTEYSYSEPKKIKLQIDDILVIESDVEHKNKVKIRKLERENRVLYEKLEAYSRSTSCGYSESQFADQNIDSLVSELRSKENELREAENPLEIHREILAIQTKISAIRTSCVVEKNMTEGSKLKKSFEKIEEELIIRDSSPRMFASKLSVPSQIYSFPSASEEIEFLRSQLHLCMEEKLQLEEELEEMSDVSSINRRLERAEAKETAVKHLTSMLEAQEEQLKNETIKVLRKEREIEEEKRRVKILEISALERMEDLDEKEKDLEIREKTLNQPLLNDREFASMYSRIKNSIRILKEENDRLHLEMCSFEKEKARIYVQKEKILSIWPTLSQLIEIFN